MSTTTTFSRTDDLGPQTVAVSSVFAVLATLAVAGRLCSRRVKRVAYGADDYMIVVALLFNWAFFGVTIQSVLLGLGKHTPFVKPPSNILILLRLLFVASLLYKVAAIAVKVAILLLYKRIFVTETFTRVIYAVGASILTYSVLLFFLTLFECQPMNAAWTGHGSCPDSRMFAVAYAICNIIADFVIWIMPIPMVWKLHLPLGQRIGISLVFLLGLFDAGAAVARLVVTLLSTTDLDFVWYDAIAYEWSIIELSAGIICACLPIMRNVLLVLLPKSLRRVLSDPARDSPVPSPLLAVQNHGRAAQLSVSSEERFHNNSIALALVGKGDLGGSGKRSIFQREVTSSL